MQVWVLRVQRTKCWEFGLYECWDCNDPSIESAVCIGVGIAMTKVLRVQYVWVLRLHLLKCWECSIYECWDCRGQSVESAVCMSVEISSSLAGLHIEIEMTKVLRVQYVWVLRLQWPKYWEYSMYRCWDCNDQSVESAVRMSVEIAFTEVLRLQYILVLRLQRTKCWECSIYECWD